MVLAILAVAAAAAGVRGAPLEAAEASATTGRALLQAGLPPVDSGLGEMGPLVPLPIVPAASAVLPNGKILAWSAYMADRYFRGPRFQTGGGGVGTTEHIVFDIATSTPSQYTVSNTNHDMFCPGIATLADGDILVTGGMDATATSRYDLQTGTWIEEEKMSISRGYGSLVTLSNGRALTLGGSFSGPQDLSKDGELWNPRSGGSWKRLNNVTPDKMLTDDPQGRTRWDNYGMFFAWSRKSVLQVGPSRAMNWIFTGNQGKVKGAGTRPSGTSHNGNAVMFDAGEILTFGGSQSFNQLRFDGTFVPGAPYPVVDTTVHISIGRRGRPPATKVVGAMNIGRTYANGIALPDGRVLAIGGSLQPVEFDVMQDTTGVLQPEIYDPATEEWTLLDVELDAPRMYHSTAVLMPDGRVFTAGGGLCSPCTVNHYNAQVFSPPYLFAADGSPATRPTVALNKSNAKNGDNVNVSSDGPIGMVAMVRYGSATHSTNTDQRRIELCGPTAGACGTGNSFTMQVPSDDGIAIPGNWMIFVINNNGVPSESANLLVK